MLTVAPVRDVTDPQEANAAREREEQLRARVERLEVLAGEAAHNLKNLLGVILNCAEFAVESAAGQPDLRADLVEIVGAAERASAVATSLEQHVRESSTSMPRYE